MILSKKVKLTGNVYDRILQILKMAGWYENRHVCISQVEQYYKNQRVPLIGAAKSFFEEYYGIADSWFIMYGPTPGRTMSPDFHFDLYPSSILDDVSEHVFDDSQSNLSQEQRIIDAVAKEATTHVGEIGYYYPARVWIGESGNFYIFHEYDHDQVHVYQTLMEFLEKEFSQCQCDFATVLVLRDA